MEVVAATPNCGGVPPFHNHDVREWSRIDSLTGVLERARLETDHWTANTNNSSHKYGKVVDSRTRSGADGNLQGRRQLEILQSQIPGGRLQVVKTHVVSNSRWTDKLIPTIEKQELTQNFENLQLSINPLDLSSEKSKASVGRNVGRRPPSRQQRGGRDESLGHEEIASTNFHRVSRLCHQIHDNAVRHAFGKYLHQQHSKRRPSIRDRQNGDGSVQITEIETTKSNGHVGLTRTKSISSEDLQLTTEREKSTKSIEDLEDLEQLQNWRRTSKIRRSLQSPKQNKTTSKPTNFPKISGSVRKVREDLEKGRRLNTALRGNNVDLEALGQILQSISSASSDKTSVNGDRFEETEQDSSTKQKRNSFVTVESIQEVRGRLRRTSSPSSDIYKEHIEDPDDGIVTGDSTLNLKSETIENQVTSYIYGMEQTRKSISGTGSLESRSKQQNGNSMNRNEDWYNRRKSYGFEKVHNQQVETISKSKRTVESSTDSGICRSTEIVIVPTITEDVKSGQFSDSDGELRRSFRNSTKLRKYSSIFGKLQSDGGCQHQTEIEGTTITIPIVSKTSPAFNTCKLFERELGNGTSCSIESWDKNEEDIKRHSLGVVESKYVTKTNEPKFRKPSLAINPNDEYFDNEDDNNILRRPKKVEFCKTEVHFAADSGRVNIVETDEKPPPTNNFRRRRKNSGLLNENFRIRNGLPAFQFGDEKNLFGVAELENGTNDNYEYEAQNITCGTVTVNTNTNNIYQDHEDEYKDFDNEILKGILKNKPIKPKPYILGDSDNYLTDSENQENKPWGVRLRPVRDDTPIWRSTVTVKNTFFDKESSLDSNHTDIRQSKNESEPEFQKMLRTLRPTTRRPETFNEHNGGCINGIRIVSPLIDTRRSSWSVADRVKHVDMKCVENKGYSTKINFGNGEATVIENNEQARERHPTWPRREDSSSDSLEDRRTKIPQQLEALRKLYDDVQSDSETDKEVQSLMSKVGDLDGKLEDECSSVVSGSWSKIRAFKNFSNFNKVVPNSSSIAAVNSHAHLEKDLTRIKNIAEPLPTKLPLQHYENDLISKNESNIYRSKATNTTAKYSPIVVRKSYISKTANLKSSYDAEQLSSPALVGQNRIRDESSLSESAGYDLKHSVENLNSPVTKTKSLENKQKLKIKNKSAKETSKVRTTYIGSTISPKTSRKKENLTEKPDLLQFDKDSFKKTKNVKKISKTEPIYENIQEIMMKKNGKRQFDSTILEELTKAADQILQAVNGYTDEDSQNKFSTDDEDKRNGHLKREPLDTISETKSWKQDKTTQSKSLQNRKINPKTKLKHTSSTSSIDSITRECRKSLVTAKMLTTPSSNEQKSRRKMSSSDSASAKANTKARRLQRASSREALLQSHGSSSEDLATNAEVPLRKPRLVRKTKISQLTVRNGLEISKKPAPNVIKKREDVAKNKIDDRLTNAGLPEIRHKTAISTIRSTTEKTISRERYAKSTGENLKKKPIQKREIRGPSSSTRNEPLRSTLSRESTNHRISTASSCNLYVI